MYDMKNVQKLQTLETKAPEAWKAFAAFDKAALAEGEIPRTAATWALSQRTC